MHRTVPLSFRGSITCFASRNNPSLGTAPVVQIKDGTFYRRQPAPSPSAEELLKNPPLFPNLNFALPSSRDTKQFWCIVGPSSAGKSTLLQILQGQHLCFPPRARLYPFLSSEEIAAKDNRLRYPARAIQYVGFNEKNDLLLAGMGSYLSARYESRREVTDFSLLDYLKGDTSLNPGEKLDKEPDDGLLDRVIDSLNLRNLITFPLNHLSNGQSRRARIAKALLARPEVLLLDEPFMGLDPHTMMRLSPLLKGLAKTSSPRLLLTLRPQDPIPDWITHMAYLGETLTITNQGLVQNVCKELWNAARALSDEPLEIGRILTDRGIVPLRIIKEGEYRDINDRDKTRPQHSDLQFTSDSPPEGEPVIEMDGVVVRYEDRTVLGDWTQDVDGSKKPGLWWTVRRGQRWGLFGPNGSGKTTLLSLITSDHPQAYSAPIKLFGRPRLATAGQRGISIFDIQARIGHSSPEVHNLFPRKLSIRQTLMSAFAETPLARPLLTANDNLKVDVCLRWFEKDLHRSSAGGRRRSPGSSKEDPNRPQGEKAASVGWAENLLFGELPTSAQKVALFLRAIVRNPELVILDEAFSGMDDNVRDRCMEFLEHGERAAADQEAQGSRQGRRPSENPSVSNKSRPAVAFEGLLDTQALLVISHVREEVPRCVRRYICLPDQGTKVPPIIGEAEAPIRGHEDTWSKIWGMN